MYLGIDLGTSAVKACVLAPDGAVLATTTAPLSMLQPSPGANEQDCAEWWTATIQAVTELDPALRASLRGIGLSGQMHGAVLLRADKTVLRPAILWNDARAYQECADILTALPEVGTLSGVLPMAGFTAPKLFWVLRHEPDIYSQIAHVLLPKDYIGFRLHGDLVTDPSDAAGTSWYDQAARQWSLDLCSVSATRLDWLPKVKYGPEIAGHLLPDSAQLLRLPAGLPVVAGAGDAAAGAVGIGAIDPGDAFISLGTSGQLFVSGETFRPNPASRIHAYAHTLPNRYFQMAAMLNGARPMAWLAELLGQPINALLSAAEHAPPGPLFLPYLTGERTPHGDSTIRGGFAMLDERTTPGSLMRAVIEGIAFSFADAVDALGSAGTSLDHVMSIGGGTRSDLLMQTIADATGCVLGRSEGANVGPAVGAARLAAISDRPDRATEIFRKPEANRVFVPDPAGADRLTARRAAYRALYPALKSVQVALS